MLDNRIRDIVIVGGGTAGWMSAASLIRKFGSNRYTRITLIESAEVGSVGVGEATVPAMRSYLSNLGVNEVDFVRRTDATFKLAIGFEGWAGEGTHFYHPFAEHGVPVLGVPFQAIWTRLAKAGRAKPIDAYCIASQLAEHARFAVPLKNDDGTYLFNYAFHFDAVLAAKYLKSWSITGGVKHIEGRITAVSQHADSGDVKGVTLESGREIEGDFFIDCSGFQGLLIEKTLKTGYERWSAWLPCNRAVVIPSRTVEAPASFTRSQACRAGWQWRIPLQNRIGNGYVYCSDFIEDAQAASELAENLNGPAMADPRIIPFETGMRKDVWNKNVYAIGLSSGFLEPLESTSIYVVQNAIDRLIRYFPSRVPNPALRAEVNRRNREHQEHLRDFIVLHYALNKRIGQPFWDQCRHMTLPDSLQAQIELFEQTGTVRVRANDFFRASSWLAMFSGFGIVPAYYNPAADDIAVDALAGELAAMEAGINRAVAGASAHGDFLTKNCKSLSKPAAVTVQP